MNAPPKEERYHSLDAMRAFALLLGVFFHAAESFEAGHRGWAIIDASPSLVLHYFRHASHSFRMELFFLLCGFFARLLYHRRGGRGFTWNRFNRIFIPFVVGWCILYPMLAFIWLWGASKSGQWDAIAVPLEARHLPPWKLTLGFLASGGMFQKFDLTHLWFLHQLMVLYLLVIPLRALLLRWAPAGLWPRLDTVFRRWFETRWRAVVFAALTAPVLLTMDSWDVDTPKSSLLPHAPTTLLYLGFFACGWFLHRQPGLWACLAPGWRWALVAGAALVLPTGLLPRWAWSQGFRGGAMDALRVLHTVLYALMMWSFVCGFAGWFIARCTGASRFWRYVSDASYWVYLAHLPTVVALQVALAYTPLPVVLKYPLLLAIAIPLLFLSYHFLARSTFIGQQLNGQKYPLQLPWKNSPAPAPSRPG